MKINRSKLIDDLNKVLPGIGTGTTIMEGADSVIFSNGNIYSYNSAISVITKESEERGLNGIVKAEDFYKCISSLPSEEIEITPEESVWNISDGDINVTMNLLPKNSIYDRFQQLKLGEDWITIDGADFNLALVNCSIPSNSTEFAGVYIDGNLMYSTNQWVINKFSLKNEYPKMWISLDCMKELLKWKDFNAVQYDKQWIHFRTENETIFSIRTMNVEKYPIEKISTVIDNVKDKPTYTDIELTDEFYKAVKRASAFSNELDEHEIIKVSFGPEVSVTSSRVSGSYKESVKNMSIDKSFILNFDISEILSSEGIMNKLSIIGDGDIDFNAPVRLKLYNDSCIKIFSSIN